MPLLKRTTNENTAKNYEIFRLQDGRDPCSVAKLKQILPNLPNWVWIISFISGLVLSSLFSVSPHNGNATQLIAIEFETELMFTDRHWLRGQQTEQ